MNQAMLIIAINLFAVIALIIIKTKFFLRATRKRTLSRWLYFNQFHIIEASDDKIRKLRRHQNTYTAVIAILIALLVLFIYLAKNDFI